MSVASANRSTAAPVPGARATAFTGTWPLARAALRRDRVRTPAWGVGLAAMVLAVAPTFDRLYPTAQSRLELAASLAASPSLTALLGPCRAASSIRPRWASSRSRPSSIGAAYDT